jgi:hypothetical protein
VKLFEIRALEDHARLAAKLARLHVRHDLDVLVIVDLEVDGGDASALILGAERLRETEDALIVGTRLTEIAHAETDAGESDNWHFGFRRGGRCALSSPAALCADRLTSHEDDEQSDEYFSASHLRSPL